MAKTGETRKTKQPFKVDKLPSAVIEAILFLRNERGLTFAEIEARSAEKYSSGWRRGGGFVDWDKLPEAVKLYPKKAIPESSLQRWWDVRVDQVSKNVERMAVQAREIGAVFAKTAAAGDKESVLSAARDIVLGILAEDGSVGGRAAVADALTKLASVMERGVTNKLRERVVALNERKATAFEKREKAAQDRLEAETAKLSKKAAKGEVTQADIDRLFGRVFALPPRAEAGRKAAS